MVRYADRLSGRQNAERHAASHRRQTDGRSYRKQRSENDARRGAEGILDDGLYGSGKHSAPLRSEQGLVPRAYVYSTRKDRARNLRSGHTHYGFADDEIHQTD